MANPKNGAHKPPNQGQSKKAKARRNKRKALKAQQAQVPPSRARGGMVKSRSAQVFDVDQTYIPRNEQARMTKFIRTAPDDLTMQYLMCLINPKYNLSAVPDSNPRPSSVVRSITEFNIPVQFNPSDPEAGRFSIAVQPHLGSVTTPTQYKVGIISSSGAAGWAANDFSAAQSYLQTVDGSDYRIDPFFALLTMPQMGCYQLFASPAGTNPKVFPDVPPATGEPPEFDNGSWYTFQAPGIKLITTAVGANNNWSLAPGQYLFAYIGTTADTFASNPNITVLSGNVVLDFNLPQRSPDNKMATLIRMMTVTTTSVIQFHSDLTTGGAAYTNAFVRIIPTYYSAATQFGLNPVATSPNAIPSGNYGMIQQYRPVAMTVLATYIGPEIINGGAISASYVSGGVLAANYYNNGSNSAVGQLQNWEALARYPGAYNGKITEGTYSVWRPEDMTDLQFNLPDNVVQRSMPAIIVSGQFQPGSVAATTTFSVVRIEIVTIYEVTTGSQLLPAKKCVGSQAVIDNIFRMLADQPSSMPNKAHWQWLKDFWSGVKQGVGYVTTVGGLLKSTADKVVPIVQPYL